jgi:uncharacterized protein (DUF2237 family)
MKIQWLIHSINNIAKKKKKVSKETQHKVYTIGEQWCVCAVSWKACDAGKMNTDQLFQMWKIEQSNLWTENLWLL